MSTRDSVACLHVGQRERESAVSHLSKLLDGVLDLMAYEVRNTTIGYDGITVIDQSSRCHGRSNVEGVTGGVVSGECERSKAGPGLLLVSRATNPLSVNGPAIATRQRAYFLNRHLSSGSHLNSYQLVKGPFFSWIVSHITVVWLVGHWCLPTELNPGKAKGLDNVQTRCASWILLGLPRSSARHAKLSPTKASRTCAHQEILKWKIQSIQRHRVLLRARFRVSRAGLD